MDEQKICLVMIVKDESHVLPRCLSALRPFIDSWVIVDTGSTDTTQQVIHEQLEGIPGEIHESPFESFQKNRTEALEFARKRDDAEYLLMIDADDTWKPTKEFSWPDLEADAYEVKHVLSGTSFYRPTLTKASKPWRYSGSAHEFMVCERPYTIHRLRDVKIACGSDGARRKNEPVKKYERVVAILQSDHEKDPANRRTVFYLAQAYKDSRKLEEALEFYTKRAQMGGWAEEVWFSLYQIGVLHERLDHPWKEARDAYLEAYSFRPLRAEPLVALSSLHRRQKEIHLAHIFGFAAKTTPYPDSETLFIDEHTYAWRALDEYAIAAQKLGHYEKAKQANFDILIQDDIPINHRGRIESNLTFSCTPIDNTRIEHGQRVTVTLSTYQCDDPEALRIAAQSIIDQSYENFILLVVSDGDAEPPWEALSDITDPRMKLIHLPDNIGQFAVYDAVLAATPDSLLIVQDDDDVSHPERIDKLVRNICRTNADVVFSDLQIETTDGRKHHHPSHPEWLAEHRNYFVHAGSHVGLWKTASLKRIGGYYGGFKIGADTVVVGIMSRLGRPSFLRETLYYAKRSNASMTTNGETGVDTPVRQQAWDDIHQLWKSILKSKNSIESAHTLIQERIPSEHRNHIQSLTDLCRGFFSEQKTNENHRTGS